MKILKVFMAGLVMVLASQAAMAKGDGFSIGVVDWQFVASKAPQAAEIDAKIRKEFEAKQASLISMGKELQEKADKLKRDQPILKEEEIISRKRELDALTDTLNRRKKEFEEDLERSRQSGLKKVLEVVNEAIKAVAKEKGFDVILTSETVPYISDRVDITEQVIARLSDPLAK